MSTEKNVQTVKDFFAAMGSYDEQQLLALAAEDVGWSFRETTGHWQAHTVGTKNWPAVLQTASEEVEMAYPRPPEFTEEAIPLVVLTGQFDAPSLGRGACR